MTRLKIDADGTDVLQGMTYNVFETGQGRIVKRFITVEGQQEFLIPEYNYSAKNPVYIIVNGVEVVPESIETGKITLTNPLSSGIEVVCIAYGNPAMKRDGCLDTPYEGCSNYHHPYAALKHKDTYFFSLNHAPETCTVLGVKLKRLIVNIKAGDDVTTEIRNALGFQRDKFVIHEGIVYLPYQYNGFPAVIGYNANINGVNKRTVETVIVESTCVRLNDRLFPNVNLRRGEFFGLLYNLLSNLHNRYTDTKLELNPSPQRNIADGASLDSKWYAKQVRTLFDEKFMDGCYVFPLYADDKFEGQECMTRAEAVTYLNRFIEWVTEKYR
ncbi:hypothetical protein GRF59_05585 [Paenibacillus sp. HJL G12]|uniref:SLH domain-containing protein n=2 Tax=Paenibacillus dendrobii TaxID=2691084 RepID=A0A7X3IGZ3_9BACL|nr:hypothetical protein [Paenibacillus dendrobii]MWV43096.1 hypothetical protein [Paenibacillus dendrobii]